MDEYESKIIGIYEESTQAAFKFYKKIDELYFEFMNYYNDNFSKVSKIGFEKGLIPIGVVCIDQVMDLGTMLNITKDKAKYVKILSENNENDQVFCVKNKIQSLEEDMYHSFAYPRFSSLHGMLRSICEVYAKFQLLYFRRTNKADYDALINYYQMVDYFQTVATMKSLTDDHTMTGYPKSVISSIRLAINNTQAIFTSSTIDNTLTDKDFIEEAEKKGNLIRQQPWYKPTKDSIGNDNKQIGFALENNDAWKTEDSKSYQGSYTIYTSICASTHNNISAIKEKSTFDGAIQFNTPIYNDLIGIHNFQALLSCAYFCMKDVFEKVKLILK